MLDLHNINIKTLESTFDEISLFVVRIMNTVLYRLLAKVLEFFSPNDNCGGK
jgi:hypothetical protein